MKKIPEPDLASAIVLSPAELNKIHFGGNRTPLTPDQLRALAEGKDTAPKKGGKKS
ncbi:MAG: hypothetical protein K2H64_02280 [Desulfovibrio sp.]|nr:hypothetical protein [Desulfovibrio sp.]